MTMQPGIFAFGATEHLFMTFDLDAAADKKKALQILATAANPLTTDGVNVVVGVRPSLWAEIADADDVPETAADFAEDKGEGGLMMPADQHDFWVWISGDGMDICWDWAKFVRDSYVGIAKIATEHRGWPYHANKDLTGFEDGTENPRRLEAPSIVGVDQGKPGADSCVLLYQPYEHKDFSWYEQDVEDQEKAIGRTKLENIELEGEDLPDYSHIARTDIDQDIWRRNVAYGDMGTHGTLFIGFADEQWKMEDMLDRMVGIDGIHDALMDHMFVTGSGWYTIPSVDALVKFLPEDDDED
ncbi:MAG TPA: Dyp-type peroxidase [Corynebacteriales bacterium]|nr:Dyp-type peroxidase [Mycobacteriales bacterium]